jgi:UDP-N-acetylmuramate dehydrogenase
MAQNEKYNEFVDRFGGEVKRSQRLSAYTTFGTGGEADLFIDVTDAESLSLGIKLARELEIAYYTIGGGSNLLIGDRGFRGLIIRNSIAGRQVKGIEIIMGGGESLDGAVDLATESSLTGLEFAAGIWGTVGGAVYGNAGAFGSQVGSVLEWADLIDNNGNMRTEKRGYFQFAYRHSILKTTRETVARVCFGLARGDRHEIKRRTDEIRQLRCRKHPVNPCSAGCFFKNIEDASQPNGKLPAGKLLEEVGAKKMRVGGAAVFPEHANIIVNTGTASSKDIRRLADILKEKVKERFQIELQEEVICLGEF